MEVHGLRVVYTREKQPKDYEKAAPTVELSAALEPGDDVQVAANTLMRMACTTAYAALGFDLPENVNLKLVVGDFTVERTSVQKIADAVKADQAAKADEKPLSDKLIEQAAAKAEAATSDRKRGRPAKEKPAVEEEASNISANPEDRQDPANPVADIPDDDIPDSGTTTASKPVVTGLDDIPDSGTQVADTKAKSADSEELTARDIQASVTKNLHDKVIQAAKVHEFLRHFNVARISDLKQADIGKFSIMLADEVERNKAKKVA